MKRFLLVAVLFSLPLSSFGAIAFDAGTDGNLCYPCSSLTFSHTVTGSNTYLVVLFLGEIYTLGDYVSGVTYNGVAMTQLNMVINPTDRHTYVYGLAGAATGAHDVIITMSQSVSAIAGAAASYTGVNQTTPVEATTSKTYAKSASNGTATSSITTIADNAWTIFASRDGTGNETHAYPATSSLRIWTSTGGALTIVDANMAVTPARAMVFGATTTADVNTSWGITMISLVPVAGAAATATAPCHIRGHGACH